MIKYVEHRAGSTGRKQLKLPVVVGIDPTLLIRQISNSEGIL